MTISLVRGRLAAAAALAVALTAALALLAVRAEPAAATGEACAGLMPYVCVTVFGSGGRVEQLGASHAHLPLQYCNYYAKWELYNSRGTLVRVQRSPTQHGCSYGRAWFKENTADITLGIGGKVCVRWYENGSQDGGRPCKRLG